MNEMPYNERAELYVLSDMIMSKDIDENINEDCFFLRENKELYKALSESNNIEKVIEDYPLLENHIKYVLTYPIPTGRKEHYNEILLDNNRYRKVIEIADEMADYSYARKSIDVSNIQYRLNNIEKNKTVETINLYEHMQTFIDNIHIKPEFIKTGFIGLDRFLYLEKSDLIIIAARPSCGKTAFQLQLGLNMAFNNYKVLAFSLEMKGQQLTHRIISNISEITLDKIKNKNITDNEKNHLIKRMNDHIRKLHFDISDKNYSYNSIKKIIINKKLEKGLDVVFIDYLQLAQTDSNKSRNESIGEITRNLKKLAKEQNILIILLSQLSRQVENRSDKRPMLSDLRDSGEIEQDCDTCLFLYRDEVYNPDTEFKNCMEVIVRKQRQGATGTEMLLFEKETQRIRDL